MKRKDDVPSIKFTREHTIGRQFSAHNALRVATSRWLRHYASLFGRRNAIVALVLIIIVGSGTALAWIHLSGSPSNRLQISSSDFLHSDETLVSNTLNEQQSTGFFVWSKQDANPPVIAETYFALIVLHHYQVSIPNSGALRASLTVFVNKAEQQAEQGVLALTPRDLYEIVVIGKMLGETVPESSISTYMALLHRNATINPGSTYSAIYTWYYIEQTLLQLHALTSSEYVHIGSLARTILQPTAKPELMVASMVVDICTAASISLTDTERATAIVALHSHSSQKAFANAPGMLPDVRATFFGVLLATDLHITSLLNAPRLRSWLLTQRHETGYSIEDGQPITPLATAYALLATDVLETGATNGR